MKMDKILSLTIIGISVVISAGIFISRYEKKVEIETENIFSNIKTVEISPIDRHDHILGNPNARIIIIEFTHLECPFTREFHSVMKRIIRDYGPQGKVAWVIRHYPVPDIFENSKHAAISSECVAQFGRENNRPEIFWEFLDSLFNNFELDVSKEALKRASLNVGVEENFYNRCIITNPGERKIFQDMQDAEKIIEIDREFMTPYNLIITDTGLQTRIPGSLDYMSMRNIIEEILEVIE